MKVSSLIIYSYRVGTDSQTPEDTDYKSNDNGAVSNGGSNNNVYNSTDTCKTYFLYPQIINIFTHFKLQWNWIQQNI